MKRMISFVLFCILLFGVTAVPTYAADPALSVQTAEEFQEYLNTNYATLTTELKTFDLKNKIFVVENHDEFKCYDMAVIIDWSAIEGYADIKSSTAYTEEQKVLFDNSIAAYQNSLAEITVATFPTKKVRGGFLTRGWTYPNIRMGYYEVTTAGWKNYGYKNKLLNYYKDTTISELHSYEFGEPGYSLDLI